LFKLYHLLFSQIPYFTEIAGVAWWADAFKASWRGLTNTTVMARALELTARAIISPLRIANARKATKTVPTNTIVLAA
jgi:hypothetical protein